MRMRVKQIYRHCEESVCFRSFTFTCVRPLREFTLACRLLVVFPRLWVNVNQLFTYNIEFSLFPSETCAHTHAYVQFYSQTVYQYTCSYISLLSLRGKKKGVYMVVRVNSFLFFISIYIANVFNIATMNGTIRPEMSLESLR